MNSIIETGYNDISVILHLSDEDARLVLKLCNYVAEGYVNDESTDRITTIRDSITFVRNNKKYIRQYL